MTKLIVIRHGQSLGNKEGFIQGGRFDCDLTDKGREEAEKLALALKNEKIDVIFSSSLKRALETAKIINKYHHLKINTDSRLNERDFGNISGIKKSDLTPEQKEIFKKRDFENFKVPGGETVLEQRERVKKSINDILKENENKIILIVTHGGTKACILKDFTVLSPEETSEPIPNSSITEIEIREGKNKVLKLFSKDHL